MNSIAPMNGVKKSDQNIHLWIHHTSLDVIFVNRQSRRPFHHLLSPVPSKQCGEKHGGKHGRSFDGACYAKHTNRILCLTFSMSICVWIMILIKARDSTCTSLVDLKITTATRYGINIWKCWWEKPGLTSIPVWQYDAPLQASSFK